MSTAIITSDTSINHLTGDGHPERPERVVAITEKLKKRNDLIWEKPGIVPDDILAMTHSKEYIDNLNSSFPQKGLKFLDGDTVISPGLEFGLVGRTMHKTDEAVSLKDLKNLTKIYESILKNYFK